MTTEEDIKTACYLTGKDEHVVRKRLEEGLTLQQALDSGYTTEIMKERSNESWDIKTSKLFHSQTLVN